MGVGGIMGSLIARKKKIMMMLQNQSILPAAYQQVEWVDANYNDIDLLYVPVVAPTAIITMEITDGLDNDIMGFKQNNYPSFIIDSVNTTGTNGSWYNRYGSTTGQNLPQPPMLNVKNTWEFGRIVKYNGTAIKEMAATEPDWSQNTQSFHLFAARYRHYGIRAYDFKLYDGSNLIRDLIPCYRKSDSVVGMFDLVSNVFFISAVGGLKAGQKV